MGQQLLRLILLVLLAVGGSSLGGCASMQQPTAYEHPGARAAGIERPATTLSEEESAGEKAGKAIVAGVVVGLALALLALPIVLLL